MFTNVTAASLSGTVGMPLGEDWEATCIGLAVPDMVIQRILRHANVSTTATYYIKTAADDVRNAMATLENHITQAARDKTETMTTSVKEPLRSPDSIQ